MNIEHVAIWVQDLEGMRTFYEKYFGAQSNQKYYNAKKEFESYFLTFDTGARLELMKKPDLKQSNENDLIGWAHIAFSTGSKEQVNTLTNQLVSDGFLLLNGPRTTGDGYYESVIEDPEGNLIELTV
ncbi:lactoylglutathione lyase [Pelagirhabdus alkalitolerans]|uniref:Lactoylglutathione lyase n=1 Tax=Pelagirhabdus alkalitolerans TaxID=1612202 RepID=A0A1G6IP01_9BACI|nr:VOC family protein [Pelagirhabdus alkalitolerans]SDC07735.1 lactoylglutathione lyase [Pelagirhabdus alkalitolerans]